MVENVSVFDGRRVLPGAHDVIVEGERIAAVRPAAAVGAEKPTRWVVPGLIDTHVHSTFPSEMRCYLRNGVTSLRYAGNRVEDIEGLRRHIAATEEPAPRIFSCGPMIDGSPPSYPELSEVADTPEEAREIARRLHAGGHSDSLLAVQNVTPEVLAALVEAGAEAGIPVFGQLWRVGAVEAARIGIDQLDNTSRIFASGSMSEDEMSRPRPIPERIATWRSGWATVDWDATRSIMTEMVEREVAYCPTLVRAQWAAGVAPGREERLGSDRDAPLFGEEELTAWRGRVGRATMPSHEGGGHDSPSADDEWARAIGAMLRWIGEFRDLGGRVVAGTDCQFGGIILHDELENLRGAGLDPDDVLAAATAEAAASIGRPDDLGTIRPGALADLVEVEGDPLEDPSVLRDPVRVSIGGRVVYERALDEAGAASGRL